MIQTAVQTNSTRSAGSGPTKTTTEIIIGTLAREAEAKKLKLQASILTPTIRFSNQVRERPLDVTELMTGEGEK